MVSLIDIRILQITEMHEKHTVCKPFIRNILRKHRRMDKKINTLKTSGANMNSKPMKNGDLLNFKDVFSTKNLLADIFAIALSSWSFFFLNFFIKTF